VEEAQALIEKDPSDANLLAFERAQAEFEEAGGLDVESRVASILAGLGFKKDDHTKPCTEFSGGWQMRIALAR
jgi:ATP-binding cassette subfamily F protein 3